MNSNLNPVVVEPVVPAIVSAVRTLVFRLVTICNTNTLRYEADNGGSIYITQSAMGTGILPETMTLTYDAPAAPPESRLIRNARKAAEREATRLQREGVRDSKRIEREAARMAAMEAASAAVAARTEAAASRPVAVPAIVVPVVIEESEAHKAAVALTVGEEPVVDPIVPADAAVEPDAVEVKTSTEPPAPVVGNKKGRGGRKSRPVVADANNAAVNATA